MQIGSATLRASSAPATTLAGSAAKPPVQTEQTAVTQGLASNAEAQLRSALAATQQASDPLAVQKERELKLQLSELERRERDVRASELSQAALAGRYAGPAVYSYARGPDGQTYAVAGDVSIDVSPVPNNPEATLRKMEVVMQAAMASAESSPQDLRVAAQARIIAAQARAELAEARREESATPVDERQKTEKEPAEEEKDAKAQQKPAATASLELYRLLGEMQAAQSMVSVRA